MHAPGLPHARAAHAVCRSNARWAPARRLMGWLAKYGIGVAPPRRVRRLWPHWSGEEPPRALREAALEIYEYPA